MARGFRRRGSGRAVRYAARLDQLERSVIVGLMEQVHDILDPPPVVAGGDEFERIVAGLGGLGFGVSVAAEDQIEDPPGDQIDDHVNAATGEPVGHRAGRGGSAELSAFASRDPALERLLPTGNRADDQVAAEFRRLTEAGLRRRKADQLEQAIALLRHPGQAVEVDEAGAQALLRALTDVRLVLGERLGLRDDDDVEALTLSMSRRPDDDPIVHALTVYDFLSWFQQTLAEALLAGLSPS